MGTRGSDALQAATLYPLSLGIKQMVAVAQVFHIIFQLYVGIWMETTLKWSA